MSRIKNVRCENLKPAVIICDRGIPKDDLKRDDSIKLQQYAIKLALASSGKKEYCKGYISLGTAKRKDFFLTSYRNSIKENETCICIGNQCFLIEDNSKYKVRNIKRYFEDKGKINFDVEIIYDPNGEEIISYEKFDSKSSMRFGTSGKKSGIVHTIILSDKSPWLESPNTVHSDIAEKLYPRNTESFSEHLKRGGCYVQQEYYQNPNSFKSNSACVTMYYGDKENKFPDKIIIEKMQGKKQDLKVFEKIVPSAEVYRCGVEKYSFEEIRSIIDSNKLSTEILDECLASYLSCLDIVDEPIRILEAYEKKPISNIEKEGLGQPK